MFAHSRLLPALALLRLPGAAVAAWLGFMPLEISLGDRQGGLKSVALGMGNIRYVPHDLKNVRVSRAEGALLDRQGSV